MSHPIVTIDELARLVIDELVQISPGTTISFALTCRSLEEPALSSLWKRQHSLIKLVLVLPQHVLAVVGIEGPRSRTIVSGCDSSSVRILYRFS